MRTTGPEKRGIAERMNRDAAIIYAAGASFVIMGVVLLTRSPATTLIALGLLAICFVRWADQ